MKMKKILATVSATALTVSALGVMAFADAPASASDPAESTPTSETASADNNSAASTPESTAASTPESSATSTPANAPTGVEGMAAVLGVAAVAAGALVVAKKRK